MRLDMRKIGDEGSMKPVLCFVYIMDMKSCAAPSESRAILAWLQIVAPLCVILPAFSMLTKVEPRGLSHDLITFVETEHLSTQAKRTSMGLLSRSTVNFENGLPVDVGNSSSRSFSGLSGTVSCKTSAASTETAMYPSSSVICHWGFIYADMWATTKNILSGACIARSSRSLPVQPSSSASRLSLLTSQALSRIFSKELLIWLNSLFDVAESIKY